MQSTKHPFDVVNFPIAQIQDHPRQHVTFFEIPENELVVLAQSIERKGLQNPIHVLPDGTLLAGHQRVRAMQRNGEQVIKAFVRYDLAEKGEAAQLDFMILDNLERRQLDPIARARACNELIALRYGDRERGAQLAKRVRDEVGKVYGVSGRQVDRWLELLKLPIQIQEAISTGRLPAKDGKRLLDAAAAVREEAARRVAAGEEPKFVTKEVLSGKCSVSTRKHMSKFDALLRKVITTTSFFEHLSGSLEPETRQLIEQAKIALNSLSKS